MRAQVGAEALQGEVDRTQVVQDDSSGIVTGVARVEVRQGANVLELTFQARALLEALLTLYETVAIEEPPIVEARAESAQRAQPDEVRPAQTKKGAQRLVCDAQPTIHDPAGLPSSVAQGSPQLERVRAG